MEDIVTLKSDICKSKNTSINFKRQFINMVEDKCIENIDNLFQNKSADINILRNINTETIPQFPFQGWHLAKLISVYDGDTVKLVFNFHSTIIKVNLRILGIDTPEIKSKNNIIHLAGIRCKKIVEELLESDDIFPCYFMCEDKFGGRIVGDLFFKHNDKYTKLSTYMLEHKIAVPFDGKNAKITDSEWEEFITSSSSFDS